MQRIEERIKVAFDPEKLPLSQRDIYKKMADEVMSKKYGEPIDVATHIFREFEAPAYKCRMLRDDMTGAEILYHKKLDVMNEEFDTYIGALVADLIYKQHILRSQTQKNLETLKAMNNMQSQMLLDDMKRTDHLVYVDSALNISEEDDQAIKNKEPINVDRVVKRSA